MGSLSEIEILNHVLTVISLLIGLCIICRNSSVLARFFGRTIWEVHYVKSNGSRAFYQKDSNHTFYEYNNYIIVKGISDDKKIEIKINNNDILEIHRKN